jgi:hypothetical protein
MSNEPLAAVRTYAGRYYLSVAGIVLAMQGDKCRDSDFPEHVFDPIPAEELARASVGGTPATELPIEVVRFFRGDVWNQKMLEFAANKINEAATFGDSK